MKFLQIEYWLPPNACHHEFIRGLEPSGNVDISAGTLRANSRPIRESIDGASHQQIVTGMSHDLYSNPF
jgi:hypothetical protein